MRRWGLVILHTLHALWALQTLHTLIDTLLLNDEGFSNPTRAIPANGAASSGFDGITSVFHFFPVFFTHQVAHGVATKGTIKYDEFRLCATC